jgi:hypothetical protein
MHDTAMLMGALGWSGYDAPAEIITPYFGASGTGQINAVFPVTPQNGQHIPAAQASAGRRLPIVLKALNLYAPSCDSLHPATRQRNQFGCAVSFACQHHAGSTR